MTRSRRKAILLGTLLVCTACGGEEPRALPAADGGTAGYGESAEPSLGGEAGDRDSDAATGGASGSASVSGGRGGEDAGGSSGAPAEDHGAGAGSERAGASSGGVVEGGGGSAASSSGGERADSGGSGESLGSGGLHDTDGASDFGGIGGGGSSGLGGRANDGGVGGSVNEGGAQAFGGAANGGAANGGATNGGAAGSSAGAGGHAVLAERPKGTLGSPSCLNATTCLGNQHCVSGVCVAVACNVQPRLGALAYLPLGGGPTDVIAADFNRDGKLDLAVAAGNVALLLNAGGALFTLGTEYAVQNTPDALAAIDANADGWPDLAVASSLSDEVRVLLNQGDGSLVAGATYAAPNGPTSIRAHDFNHDALDDLIYVNTGSGSVSVRLGRGDGSFDTPVTTEVEAGVRGLEIADFDADERLDLVVSTNAGLRVAWGSGDAHFLVESAVLPGTGVIQPSFGNDLLAIFDMDEDGRVDIVTYLSEGWIGFFRNAGGRNFTSTAPIADDASSGQIVVSDLNGDGHPDLALAHPTGASLRVVLSDSKGHWSPGEQYPVGMHPHALLAADVSGDSKPDLVSANLDDRSSSVLVNDGHGGFPYLDNARRNVSSNIAQLQAADLEGNGTADLIVCTSDTIHNFVGQGDGTFQGGFGYQPGTPTTPSTFTNLDADLGADRVALNGTGTVLSVELSSGKVDKYSVPWGRRILIDDFDADGIRDVALAASLDNVVVLRNQGDGTLLPAVTTGVEQGALVTGSADLNGDGAAELIGMNFRGWPLIWFNEGIGSFGQPTVLAQYQGSRWAAADFNGDKRTDLAFWETNGSMQVFLNQGSGTFADPIRHVEIGEPAALALADFDANGTIDIAGANGDRLTFLLGIGDGHFRKGEPIPFENDGYALAAADFNSDGRPDLALLNRTLPNVNVLLNVCMP